VEHSSSITDCLNFGNPWKETPGKVYWLGNFGQKVLWWKGLLTGKALVGRKGFNYHPKVGLRLGKLVFLFFIGGPNLGGSSWLFSQTSLGKLGYWVWGFNLGWIAKEKEGPGPFIIFKEPRKNPY